MGEVDYRRKDGRWSLEGKIALVTGGTKGIGFVSLCMLSLFYFQLHKRHFAVFMALASFVLRQTKGCFIYIGMLLWRNWQGLGRLCIHVLAIKVI
jgi:hypothetical protein